MQSFNKPYRLFVLILFLLAAFSIGEVYANTGKIAGQVKDKSTNEPLPGVNIIVEGTNTGASTDADGYFFIINLPPDTYTLKVEMIGYATSIMENVKVNVNQTTTANFLLETEAVEGQTVVIEATRPVVQLDVSSSQRIVTQEVIQDRPLENLEEILSTEAGIQLSASNEGTGLIVRGGGLNETDIVVDGLSTRNERNQQPVTNLSLTAIQEVEILTGGFNAEYGDIRSGLINVTTREGSLDRFAINADYRISPAARKHFGPSPFDLEGPFWQVYAGTDAFTGITQEMVNSGQYPFVFEGWNNVARSLIEDPDPGNDMTPQSLLELWKWQHRTRPYADKPDHIADFTLSGPIPKTPVSFLLSQRYEDLQLVYPFSRSNSTSSNTILKLTTYINPQMKISLNNNYLILHGVSGSIYDDTNGMITGSREGVEYAMNVISGLEYKKMWHDANYNPIETKQYRGGLALNHVLSPSTFYDMRLEYTTYKTQQEPIALRDTTPIKFIGGQGYDMQPFGYVGSEIGNITEQFDVVNEFMISGGGRGQDHSTYWGIRFSGDLVSQVNKHNQVKTGFAIDYNSFEERREINHGATTTSYEVDPTNWWYYNDAPLKLSAYLQDKLEFEGMIANFGLRADYMQPGVSPFNLDPNFIYANLPYTLSNWRANGNSFDAYRTSEKSYKLYLSPRLGISHPMTTSSKIFFNYGHFFQPPVNDQLYSVRPASASAELPRVPVEWPRTIAYEIGFEQRVYQDFMIHILGYYKDVDNQLSSQEIHPLDDISVVYTLNNNSYADIRGLQLRLEKRVGLWWYGFATLEYMVKSTGLTGFANIYEDPQLADLQRESPDQTRDDPVPSVTANMTFRTPREFGPDIFGHKFFGDWRMNVLFEWSDGGTTLLNPDAPLSEQHRVGVIDYSNTDMLLEKRFNVLSSRFGVYMQVRNLFNNKGFPNPFNWTRYVDSLHFPYEQGSQKGNDKLGDYDKDYIDLGWNTWSQFVNPRDIFFGVRIQM